jgi:hypothetical protein
VLTIALSILIVGAAALIAQNPGYRPAGVEKKRARHGLSRSRPTP